MIIESIDSREQLLRMLKDVSKQSRAKEILLKLSGAELSQILSVLSLPLLRNKSKTKQVDAILLLSHIIN